MHTRPNPTARSSTAPELPLVDSDDDGQPGDDAGPPGLDDDASTIDYRDQDEAESDQDVDDEGDLNLTGKDFEDNAFEKGFRGHTGGDASHTVPAFSDSFTQCLEAGSLESYLEDLSLIHI